MTKSATPPRNICLAAILKNEAPYIKEWLEYHKLIGVERFYLYDNESTDNVKEILEPYIKDGTVVYRYTKGHSQQMPAYVDAILRSRKETRWLAIIDLDEFIVPLEKNSLGDFLNDYEKYPAVVINWLGFDSNGYTTQPKDKLICEAYTRVRKEYQNRFNRHVKTILKPKEVIDVHNPHCFKYRFNKLAVDENFKPMDKVKTGSTEEVSINKIQINHYHTKSAEEYLIKTQRGNPDSTNCRKFIKEYLNYNSTTHNYAIQRFIPELKKRMSKN